MDTILLGPVGSCIGDRAATHVDDPVSALLNPFHVRIDAVILRHYLPSPFGPKRLPESTQIGCSFDKRFGTIGEYRLRKVLPEAAGRSVGNRNVVGEHLWQGTRLVGASVHFSGRIPLEEERCCVAHYPQSLKFHA